MKGWHDRPVQQLSWGMKEEHWEVPCRMQPSWALTLTEGMRMAEKSSRIMPPMPDLRPPPNIHAVMVARMLPKRGRRKAEADDVGISPPSMLSSPPSSILPAGATVGTAVGTSRSGTNSNSSRMSRGWAFGAGVVGTRSMVGSDVSTVGSSVPMGTSSSKSPWLSSGSATATATSDASSGKSSSSIITDAGKSSTVGCCSWRWSVAAEAVMPAVLVLLMPLQLPHRPRRRTAHRPAERERAAQYAPKESEHIAAQIASLRSSSRIWASPPCRILCSLAATATVLDEDDGDEEWSRSWPAASAGDADAAMAAAAAPRAAAPSRRFNPLPIILICLHWWSCVVWRSGNTT
mmetsp:Transcript_3375/g.7747  ORF Transcript_3375/g.7747 Transcript_3375/m.7747 type:complete len:348 (+) Transcript_3375:1181-2224(+)